MAKRSNCLRFCDLSDPSDSEPPRKKEKRRLMTANERFECLKRYPTLLKYCLIRGVLEDLIDLALCGGDTISVCSDQDMSFDEDDI